MSIPRISINTPVDVLESVPALLGFYPTESLVCLYLDQVSGGMMLGLTARADRRAGGRKPGSEPQWSRIRR